MRHPSSESILIFVLKKKEREMLFFIKTFPAERKGNWFIFQYMDTRATCRHEVRRRSRAPRTGGRTPIGALHDKDSLPPLHFLCKVKQFSFFFLNEKKGCNDYGTRFDLRSKLLLLKQRSLFWLFILRTPCIKRWAKDGGHAVFP